MHLWHAENAQYSHPTGWRVVKLYFSVHMMQVSFVTGSVGVAVADAVAVAVAVDAVDNILYGIYCLYFYVVGVDISNKNHFLCLIDYCRAIPPRLFLFL